MTDLKVDFEMVAPKNNSTKMDAKTFKAMTGYNGSMPSMGGMRDVGFWLLKKYFAKVLRK